MSGNLVESGPPVAFGNDIMFKNKYCALCYDVKEYIPFEVEFYNIKMTSDEYEYFQNQTKKSKLSYIFMNADYKLVLPPSLNLRICVLNLIDNSQTHCQRYINPTVVMEGRDLRVYRNEFCMSDYDKQNGFDCFARFMRLLWQVVDINTLSVIFSFKETKLEKEGDITCQKWSEEIERSNSCAHLETYDNYVINLEYYVVSPKNQSKSELVGIGLVSLWTFVVTNFTKCSSKIILEASESQMIVRVTASLLVTKKLFSNEIHEIDKSFNEQELDIVIKDNSTENVAVVKKRNNISGIENDLVTRFDVIFHKRLHFRATEEFFSRLLQFNNIHTPVMNLMFCIYHKVFVNSFQDGGMYIDSEKNLCDRIQVLESTSNLALITYVCFSLSVISLAIVISFNRKHKFHCSVPGSNMENLSTSLLLANIVFMFGIGASRISRVCYIAGIILHYLWLTVFSYMTIAIAHIVYTISQLKSRNSIKHEDVVNKRRMVTFVGLLIPLLIVIPGIVVDQFGPEYWSLGYGGSVCFPNKYPANIIFFSGPVVFGVAVDCICMVQIVTQICRVRMGMRHFRKLNIYEDAQIYLRIVVLSGVFWVTGIVAAISEFEWLDYVFTILCGLQGFFIAVANMTTTRVLKTKRAVSKSLT
ncbi:Hypothetical predicted protein [Mytilus galloprovincialis]|uniref:G-protein coupled receptors family 2 profile 2 domain-containing protein n=1 Tax=Mytilus galloprovincialis TaxID=29158 RepID=A0A8B6G2P0_MYTGA|nr:Hypothetical predicted protein [Mytilus galloprovincialis]